MPEREFDDQVYEDEYYEEHYDEEELEDEDRLLDDDDEEWSDKKIHMSFACEECDYRWDDVIVKDKEDIDSDEEEFDVICPMCGSMNISQI